MQRHQFYQRSGKIDKSLCTIKLIFLYPSTERCSTIFFRKSTSALLAATGTALPTANIPRSPFPYPSDSSFSFRPEMPVYDARF